MSEPRNDSLYRKGVVALIRNESGLYLFGRMRNSEKPGWQFPQGGIEPGETEFEAIHREIWEETRLQDLRVLSLTPEWIHYDWPADFRRKDDRLVGQMHRYFVLTANERAPILPEPTEDFDEFKWLTLKDILQRCLPFKRSAYQTAFHQLGVE